MVFRDLALGGLAGGFWLEVALLPVFAAAELRFFGWARVVRFAGVSSVVFCIVILFS